MYHKDLDNSSRWQRHMAEVSAASSLATLGSGNLYEGNYHEWKVCIGELLRREELGEIDDDEVATQHALHTYNWPHARAADVVARHVEPRILRGVRTDEQWDVSTFLRRLRAVAKSFRFLDLPPESRNVVYDLIFADMSLKKQMPLRKQWPAITQATQQLREESLHIYYTAVECFSVTLIVFAEDMESCTSRLREGVRLHDPQRIAEVRRLNLMLDIRNVNAYHSPFDSLQPICVKVNITITFTTQHGLEVIIPDRLEEQSRALLAEHFRLAEAIRETLGLEGGHEIVHALLMDTSIWLYPTLRAGG